MSSSCNDSELTMLQADRSHDGQSRMKLVVGPPWRFLTQPYFELKEENHHNCKMSHPSLLIHQNIFVAGSAVYICNAYYSENYSSCLNSSSLYNMP